MVSESSLDAGALQKVAGQILDKFSEIHRLSKSKLEKRRRPGLGTLAPGSSHGMSSLLKIDMAINESLSVLMKEPAIAKVVLEDEFGALETFYICRTMPVDGIKNLASYRSDIGSCASRYTWRVGQS